MAVNYHLDRVMTKGELQMQIRRISNFLRGLSESLVEADLKHGHIPEAHAICDSHLAAINNFLKTMPTEELVARAIESGEI